MGNHRCIIIPMPVSPIEKLTVKFREVLHLPDPDSLYILMGAVAANMIEGPPVWLMLVGPPSCGKSELLNSLLTVPNMVEAADISSEAAFLSGTSAKDRASDATGGLLQQTGKHGALILNDFTSILSKPQDRIAAIMAVLREAYGGRWTRHIGAEGGRAISWSGKLAVLAGCTTKIDQHSQINAELGERWIYWRYSWRETFAEVCKALSPDRGDWRESLRETVKMFFIDLELQFGCKSLRRDFTTVEQYRLYQLASFAATCRSGVARDRYTHEIVAARESELATRLATVLAQLLIGLDHIGVGEKTRWRLLAKVAMDSMPVMRRMVIDAVATQSRSIEDLQLLIGCSLTTTRRTVEDMTVHGIVTLENNRVTPTEWTAKHHKLFR